MTVRRFCAHLLYIIAVLICPAGAHAADCIETKFLFDIRPGANQPSDIAVGPNGNIHLVDGVNNRIIVVGSDGRWKFDFGSEGTGKGQFIRPVGIDVSERGNIFIADTGNHRIQVFDSKGKFLYMFNVRTSSEEHRSDPVDVAISRLNNYLYIADNENHKIKVYNQNGTYEFQWGRFGEDYGAFRYPGMMILNQYNEIYIVDVLNTRVQKFDPFGKFMVDIGSWGVLQGKLFRPKGVAIDKKERVFISDSYMGVVQAFTDFGRFVGVVCSGNKVRKFNTPVGIHIDKNDRLLVVEMRSNRITVLRLLN